MKGPPEQIAYKPLNWLRRGNFGAGSFAEALFAMLCETPFRNWNHVTPEKDAETKRDVV